MMSYGEENAHKTAKEYQKQGIQNREEGDYSKAINKLNKAIDLDPLDDSSFAELGYCRQLLKEYDEAINNYNKAIQLNNNDESFYNNRGCCFEELGRLAEAINDYTSAIEINPEESILFLNRADARIKTGDYIRAILDYSKYLSTHQTCADAYVKRGKAYVMMANMQKAKDDLQVAAKLGNKEADRLSSEVLAIYFNRPDQVPRYETYSYNSSNNMTTYQSNRDTYSYRYSDYASSRYEKANECDPCFNYSLPTLESLYTKAINNCSSENEIQSSNEIKNEINPKALEDLFIVITGTIPDMNRKQVESLVKEAGGIIKGSITSKTNLLIAGEDAGSKLKKAKANGIQIINKDQLIERIKIKSTRELLVIWSKLSEEETLKRLKTEPVPKAILNLLEKCNNHLIRKATLLNQNTSLATFAKTGLYKDASTRLRKFILTRWGSH